MMANDNTAIIIIGMVLIVALVMYGPITEGFGNFLNDAWDTWGDIFEGVTDGEGFTGIGLKIHYTDGSVKDYEPQGLSLFPLTIYDDGKEVSRIEPYITLLVEWTGELSNWEIDTNIVSHITVIPDEPFVSQYGLHYDQASKGTLINGELKQFSVGTKSVAEIDRALGYENKPSGTYMLKMELFDTDVTLTLDGETHRRTGLSAQTIWTFEYDKGAGINSLSIAILVGSIYL